MRTSRRSCGCAMVVVTKPRSAPLHAVWTLVVLCAALLIRGAQCQPPAASHQGGANLTVVGTVFCDACASSSFSNHSYFLPGVRVRLDCMIRVHSSSKEEIKITAEKVTNTYGAYQLDIPGIDGFECAAAGDTSAESFCRAAVLDNPSALCNVPAVTSTVGHVSLPTQGGGPNACLYSLNSLYYRPGKPGGPGQCGDAPRQSPAALNTSLFYCPPWPWPPIPFCTPRPWFPPIPFLTPPPPPFFPFPLPPIPFLTPPSSRCRRGRGRRRQCSRRRRRSRFLDCRHSFRHLLRRRRHHQLSHSICRRFRTCRHSRHCSRRPLRRRRHRHHLHRRFLGRSRRSLSSLLVLQHFLLHRCSIPGKIQALGLLPKTDPSK